jgi:hypothetical protein
MVNRQKELIMAKARNFRREYDTYQGTPEQKKRRAKRNNARRKLMREGRVHKGDGKDVDHKGGISKGNSKSNLRVVSKSKNRGFKRSKKGKNLGLK